MRPRFVKDFYQYVADFGTITTGTTKTANVNIETDAEFIVDKITYFGTVGGAAQTKESRVVPLVEISLNDTGSGRNLQNLPVPLDCMAGTAELPFVLPVPRKFKPNATITVTATNISAATDYDNLKVVFSGYKKFAK